MAPRQEWVVATTEVWPLHTLTPSHRTAILVGFSSVGSSTNPLWPPILQPDLARYSQPEIVLFKDEESNNCILQVFSANGRSVLGACSTTSLEQGALPPKQDSLHEEQITSTKILAKTFRWHHTGRRKQARQSLKQTLSPKKMTWIYVNCPETKQGNSQEKERPSSLNHPSHHPHAIPLFRFYSLLRLLF